MPEIDYVARLALVQAAITALLTGKMQSYDLDGQKVTYLDLDSLLAEEKRLVALARRQTQGARAAFKRGVMS
ncbi:MULTISPECIES: hypothetical protein [unclassified Sagittula]|jgi:hypothetical protein|uniref:hypothetical protein n=1 Tax=unclassified Sagittula TaxID=2624628 RepID=UPI0024C37B14|nr:hypothetical protein [Sagittula sp. MA-2]WHZ33418.1 hypothetical protein QNI11_12215 [Sagittula sp. MA-2]